MPFSARRLAAATVAASMLLGSGGAWAQAQRPAQPAAPAPQQTAPQGQQPPQGPVRVDLQPSQGDWTKVCGKDQAANKEICYTTRDFGQGPDQPPVLALAVYDVKGDDTKIIRLLLPVSLLLRPGFRYTIDKGAAQEGSFEICFPNGCFAESKVKVPVIETLKKGSVLNIVVRNQVNNEVTFGVPLAGFGKAYDGAPIDPKVLEEQQRALEQQLQKRAEEERKRLEAQQSGGAAPPAAPAPAAPAGK
jgi:invasion protein IalB